MAVRLRLRRAGKKKMPVYHIVAADSRAARSGKFLEVVGRYDPLQEPLQIATKDHRVFYWLKSGARPSDTVRSLFQRTGLWLKWSLMRKGLDETAINAEMEKWQMGQAEKRLRDEARRKRRAVHRKAKRSAEAGSAGAAAPAAPVAPEAPPQA